MRQKEPKGWLILDWNGTLLDDADLTRASTNYVLEQFDFPHQDSAKHRDCYDMPVSYYYEKLGMPPSCIKEHSAQLTEYFIHHYTKNLHQSKLMAGAHRVLDALEHTGVQRIVLSNFLKSAIGAHLKLLGAHEKIETVLAYDDIAHQTQNILATEKTVKRVAKIDFLKEHLSSYAELNAPMIVVGDSPEEMEIARAFNATSIAITQGNVSEARLKAARPDYMVTDFFEIMPILKTKGLLP